MANLTRWEPMREMMSPYGPPAHRRGSHWRHSYSAVERQPVVQVGEDVTLGRLFGNFDAVLAWEDPSPFTPV